MRNKQASYFWKIFWSVAPMVAFAILVIALIMVSTESVDRVVWGR